VTRDDFDPRWLASSAVAGVLCVSAMVLASGLTQPTAEQVLTAVAWMAAIVGVCCLVRGGVDAGVHRRADHPAGSART
jgi:hypothetical protein